MSASDQFDINSTFIKTEPVDSFEWGIHNSNDGNHHFSENQPNFSEQLRRVYKTGNYKKDDDDDVFTDNASEIARKVGNLKRSDSNNDEDDAADMAKTLANIKRRDSNNDSSYNTCSADGDACSNICDSGFESSSHFSDTKLASSSKYRDSVEYKPTREALEAHSKNVSPAKSSSVQSLWGGEASLGKTLASSLQLIATNTTSLPVTQSPVSSDKGSYRIETTSDRGSFRIETASLTSSSHHSMENSPVVSPAPRKYRTRSTSRSQEGTKMGKKRGRKRKLPMDLTDNEMMKELQTEEGSVPLYQCEQCSKIFYKKQTLRQHFITHTDRFACNYCETRCKSAGDLRTHIQTHTKEKPYHCDVCNTDYTRESILRKHLGTQLHMRAVYEHENALRLQKFGPKSDSGFIEKKPNFNIVYSCHECSKVLRSKAEYRKHMNSHMLKHVCSVCQKGCKSALLLKIHKRSHEKSLSLYCRLCSRVFANAFVLKEHLKLHRNVIVKKEPEENFIQDAANKNSGSIAVNGKRAGKYPLQKLECEVCKKTFTSEKRFQNHSRIHKGTYICGMCKKAFTSVIKLKVHMKCHTGLYRCEICNAEFVQEQKLNEHAYKQHGYENDRTCKICYEKFENEASLQQHMNDHAPTMLFSGACIDESTIPLHSKVRRTNIGYESSKVSDTEESSEDEEDGSAFQKKLGKPEIQKDCESDDESILSSDDFYEIINCALDGSDDDLNETEIEDSDHELYHDIKRILEDDVLESAENEEAQLNIPFPLQKPLLYSKGDIMKKHTADFEKYSEIDEESKLFNCKICKLVFTEHKFLKNHLRCHVCEYCNKFFESKENLTLHKSRHVQKLLKQIKSEANRLHLPKHKWKGFTMASSDSEGEGGSQFLNELEDILEGDSGRAPGEGSFLPTLSHDEIVAANKPTFEQYSCLDVVNNIFACTLCKRSYARPTTLTRHFKTHVCQFCGKFFEDKADLLEHKYRHRKKAALMKAEITGEGSKLPPSPLVSKPNRTMFKKFSYVDSARNINRCTLCNKNFVRRTVLTRHMKTHICCHCDKFFEDKYDLAKHVSYHKVEKQYLEEEEADQEEEFDFEDDDKTFPTPSSIPGNIQPIEKSVNIPSFSSSLSHYNQPYSQPNRNEAIAYIQIPTTENAGSAGSQVYSRSARVPPSFQIISQPMEGDTQGSFLVASTSYRGNTPGKIITIQPPSGPSTSMDDRERMFECGECGKKFLKNGHLKSHMNIHTGDRPFVCRLCGKAFARSTTLRKHEKTHMKRCKICDTSFNHKYELDLHMEIHRTYSFYK